jgi:hypothetical protein
MVKSLQQPLFKKDWRKRDMEYLRGKKITHLDQANDFEEAYRRCFEPRDGNRIVAIPGFANGFFACELYLNFLSGNKERGHGIGFLYSKLNELQQNKLISEYKRAPIENLSFETFLEKIDNGFIFWRYLYQDKNKEFEEKYPFYYSELFLKIFLPLLKKIAEELNEEQSANKESS